MWHDEICTKTHWDCQPVEGSKRRGSLLHTDAGSLAETCFSTFDRSLSVLL